MPILTNFIASSWKIIGAVLLVVGAYFYVHHLGYVAGEIEGKAYVQNLWNIEEAAEKKEQDDAKVRDHKAKIENDLQHERDIASVKSNAGRDAISSFLRSHGLLPDGTSVRDSAGKPDSGNQANIPERVYVPPGESGTSAGIEGFAGNCGQDALMILRVQEWAKNEKLPVSE
jgi:hypothetical protein